MFILHIYFLIHFQIISHFLNIISAIYRPPCFPRYRQSKKQYRSTTNYDDLNSHQFVEQSHHHLCECDDELVLCMQPFSTDGRPQKNRVHPYPQGLPLSLLIQN